MVSIPHRTTVLHHTIGLALLLCALSIYAQFKKENSVADKAYFSDNSREILANHDHTILSIPLNDVRVAYINETSTVEKKEFPDSFFIESANDLITYECSKQYAIRTWDENPAESLHPLKLGKNLRCSLLKQDTVLLDSVSHLIKTIAEKYRVDLVCVPYACSLKNIVFQQNGWRRESPNTARPIKYKASTAMHLQIWDKEGTLLYEKVGTNQTKRPILYSFFRKRKIKEDEDVAAFSRKYFSPPLLRSLAKSISSAMDFNK